VSAWLWSNTAIDVPEKEAENYNQYFLMVNRIKNKNYYTIKQFSKYLRSGAHIIEANSDDKDLILLAAQHNESQTLTWVLLNQSKTEKKINLKIESGNSTVPSFWEVYQTNFTDNCKESESISSDTEITIPPLSLLTFVGKKSSPTAIVNKNNSQEVAFTLHPNPANDRLFVNSPNKLSNVIIYQSNGSKVIEIQATEIIDISNLRNGLYLLEAIDKEGRRILKKFEKR
jgi:hypothetical protein